MQLIETYFLWFVFYSFLGWVYETILVSSREKCYVNRGFLNGPYTPIYGFGALLNYFFLNGVDNLFVVFFVALIGAGILEYFTSWGMEKLFCARWWDYSDEKFNLNGRIFLLGLIIFATFALLQHSVIQPIVSYGTALIPDLARTGLSLVLFAIMIFDVIYTVAKFSKFETILQSFDSLLDGTAESVKSLFERAAEEIVEEREKINSQVKRMVTSFPKLQSMNDGESMQILRELVGYQDEKEK